VAISTFGVPLAIRTSGPALMTSVRRILPPDNVPIDLGVTLTEFALDHDKTGMFHVSQDDRPLARAAELATAIGSLDAHIRLFIASNAPGHVFIHAGAVTHRGLGLLLPGPSLAGKTELVACLVKIGATYYSDEYAVLDPNGLLPLSETAVHSHSRPPRVDGRRRRPTGRQTRHTACARRHHRHHPLRRDSSLATRAAVKGRRRHDPARPQRTGAARPGPRSSFNSPGGGACPDLRRAARGGRARCPGAAGWDRGLGGAQTDPCAVTRWAAFIVDDRDCGALSHRRFPGGTS